MLRSLQKHTSNSIPFVESFVYNQYAGSPKYIVPGSTQFDFTPLLVQNSPNEVHEPAKTLIGQVVVGDRDNVRKLLSRCQDSLCLDAAQVDAFATLFSQAVVLIQGFVCFARPHCNTKSHRPPGTGKTHIGVKIVQVLVHNDSRNDSSSHIFGSYIPKYPALETNTRRPSTGACIIH